MTVVMPDTHVTVPDKPAPPTPTPRKLRSASFRSRLGFSGLLGLAVLVVWVAIAILAPVITQHNPTAPTGELFAAPSSAHWFGTDELGRDVFSRVIFGARLSLPFAVVLVLSAGIIGCALGAIAGFFGGWLDNVIMRLTDLFLAFPQIILAMVITAALGRGLINVIIAMTIVAWPSYARVCRSVVLAERRMEYIQAARLLRKSPSQLILREVLPNAFGPLLVFATMELGQAVLLISSLSFLGLGAQPPAAEWGSMVSDGANAFDSWWIGMFAGLAILSVVVGANLLGDKLRDYLDPRTARHMEVR